MAGRKITDFGGMPHTSDMSMASKNHVKHYHSAEGSGHLSEYSDTSELVQRDQSHGDSKIKGRPMKSGNRY